MHLARFVKRRVDKILVISSPEAWNYVNTSVNPTNVGTRESSVKHADAVNLWLNGPVFLRMEGIEPRTQDTCPIVLLIDRGKSSFERLIESCPDLYWLKKRAAYLTAFKELVIAKAKKVAFERPVVDASYLDTAFLNMVNYVQKVCFGAAVDQLKHSSPDQFEAILKKLSAELLNTEQMHHVSELKTLCNLRPCVEPDSMLREEGRLENASLPVDTNLYILPGRHALTRLIVLSEHSNAGHAGPSYTLMQTRQRSWIIHGISSVKRSLSDCGKCALKKAKPIRQLMADLPSFRVTAANKPFKFCGTDYFGPIMYKQSRSLCKARGLLFTCLCTRCVQVEIVTGLDLNNFILAFSRFVNLRGPVDTFFF